MNKEELKKFLNDFGIQNAIAVALVVVSLFVCLIVGITNNNQKTNEKPKQTQTLDTSKTQKKEHAKSKSAAKKSDTQTKTKQVNTKQDNKINNNQKPNKIEPLKSQTSNVRPKANTVQSQSKSIQITPQPQQTKHVKTAPKSVVKKTAPKVDIQTTEDWFND